MKTAATEETEAQITHQELRRTLAELVLLGEIDMTCDHGDGPVRFFPIEPRKKGKSRERRTANSAR